MFVAGIVLAFIGNIIELISVAYKVMMFSELEVEHLNPADFCKKFNWFVLPEVGLHAGVTAILLLTGHWFLFLLNAPYLAFRAKTIQEKKHLLQPERLYQRDNTKIEQRKILIALAFCVVAFFVYLYCMTTALIGYNEKPRQVVHRSN